MVIYDYDADMEKASANKGCCGLDGMEKVFVEVAIWYGGNDAQCAQNRCLKFALE